MTKAKAKQLVDALLDLDLTPEIMSDGAEYKVRVSKPSGASVTSVANLATSVGVNAQVTTVEFS